MSALGKSPARSASILIALTLFVGALASSTWAATVSDSSLGTIQSLWISKAYVASGDGIGQVSVGDLDGDGVLEVAVAYLTFCSGGFDVLALDGTTVWSMPILEGARGARIVDLDEDGAAEIAAFTGACGSKVRVLEQDKSNMAGWSPPKQISTYVDGMLVGHLSSANHLSVVAGTWGDNRAWSHDGTERWRYGGTAHSSAPHSLGDWNGDGLSDVIIKTSSDDGRVHLLQGSTGERLCLYGAAGSPRLGLIVDSNGDGLGELLTWTLRGEVAFIENSCSPTGGNQASTRWSHTALVPNTNDPILRSNSAYFSWRTGSVGGIKALDLTSGNIADVQARLADGTLSLIQNPTYHMVEGDFFPGLLGTEVATIDTGGKVRLYAPLGTDTWLLLAEGGSGAINLGKELLLTAVARPNAGDMLIVRDWNKLIALEPGNLPPIASIAAVPLQECIGGGAAVTLDGKGSYDPNGHSISYSWSASAVVLDDPASATPTGTFSLGSTPVTLTVTDSLGASNTAEAIVTVVDTLPPSVVIARPVNGSAYAHDMEAAHGLMDAPIVAVGPLTVEASAMDQCGVLQVDFRSTTGLSATDSNAPYSFLHDPGPVASGQVTVTAAVLDLGGHMVTTSVDFVQVGIRV